MSKITVTQIRDRVELVRQDKLLAVQYSTQDTSVQAELRLRAEWEIRYPVDEIKYPKNLARDNNPLWSQMWEIRQQILSAARLKRGAHGGEDYHPTVIRISAATKFGPAKRHEARCAWEIEAGQAFFEDYKSVAGARNLARIRKTITALQDQQKALIPQMRAANSAFIQLRTQAKQEQARKNEEALKTGRFWEADNEAVKSYFDPPFDKNHLADVSEKWRAALFTECKSSAWKAGRGDWRHKLVGTGAAYLCGIDDNGDEWGHRCNVASMGDHGDLTPEGTVDDAMSDLFGISVRELANCQRQGDLLFCPAQIPPAEDRTVCSECGAVWVSVVVHRNDELEEEHYGCQVCKLLWSRPKMIAGVKLAPEPEPWEVRESHRVESPALERNGRYFRSTSPISVTHTSHAPLTLPPGSYRLYAIRVADAD